MRSVCEYDPPPWMNEAVEISLLTHHPMHPPFTCMQHKLTGGRHTEKRHTLIYPFLFSLSMMSVCGHSRSSSRAMRVALRALTHTQTEPLHSCTRNHFNTPPSSSSSSSLSSLPSSSHLPRRFFAYRPDPSPSDPSSQPQRQTQQQTEEDAPTPPHIRAQSTTISDVLTRYQSDGKTFTCYASQTLCEAVQIMVSSRVGCLVAMEDDGEHVAGLVTERDILSEMVSLEKSGSGVSWTSQTVAHAMTRSREMVHIKPTDHITDALSLMTSQGFRHLPVLDSSNNTNHLRGIVSMRNLVDIVYKNASAGGKAQFLTDVLPRTGIPKNTSLRKKKSGASSDPNVESYRSLFLNAGVASWPHPDKKHGEDSFVSFLGTRMDVKADTGAPSVSPLSVIAVFDGVGSWSFEQGIDPSKFSNECARALKQAIDTHPTITGQQVTPTAAAEPSAVPPLSPASLLDAAWQAVSTEKVVGSSTACILALSHDSNELKASNIGDSGFLILRHRDARVRVGSVGRDINSSAAYQVIFRSPQQLHYFNCPLQLGVGLSGEADKFESPLDADQLTSPVQEGDIIILATDGLFDNVPEETIVATLSKEMERLARDTSSVGAFHAASISSADTSATQESPMKSVADALAKVAHGLSLDRTIDSPFAVLAKENNILWYEHTTDNFHRISVSPRVMVHSDSTQLVDLLTHF